MGSHKFPAFYKDPIKKYINNNNQFSYFFYLFLGAKFYTSDTLINPKATYFHKGCILFPFLNKNKYGTIVSKNTLHVLPCLLYVFGHTP